MPLGLYLHIPFCRKRCHFCYFRVYTDKNATEVQGYLDTLAREWELYSTQRAIAGRPLNFVYFGGGTPSFLSTRQLQSLVSRMDAVSPWRHAEEITFECEPGTLTEAKLAAIREIGVTRLSLGVENFDDRILELNGRAHRSPEIGKSYAFAQSLRISADQHRSDRRHARRDRRELADVHREDARHGARQRHHLPDGAAVQHDDQQGAAGPARRSVDGEVANWSTKRRWVDEAFAAFEAAGYTVASAYAVVKDPTTKFVYRDRLWQGADMVGLGVASFGHIGGVHMQNLDALWPVLRQHRAGRAAARARRCGRRAEERMIREFVLQLKLGSVRPRVLRAQVRRRCARDVPRRRWTRLPASASSR